MTTTDFFTPYCKKLLNELRRAHQTMLSTLLVLAASVMSVPQVLAADILPPAVSDLRLERMDDGLYLGATLQFVLPELAEDALYKGIPMFFVAEAQVLRGRWYWYDRQIAEKTRYLRLSYQPLTRRWRLNISPVPFTNSGLGVVLGQNFDEYSEALSAIQRISRWKIAESRVMDSDAVHTINFRFRLDISQLPRPFQIGAVGQSGWNLLVSRTQMLPPESAK